MKGIKINDPLLAGIKCFAGQGQRLSLSLFFLYPERTEVATFDKDKSAKSADFPIIFQ
jgi:hypothetical protein